MSVIKQGLVGHEAHPLGRVDEKLNVWLDEG
jgi:hypothetical protein